MFISHSSADSWTAKQLEKEIKDRGADTFLSVIDVAGGDEIGEKIQIAMENADECLVLYTPEAAQSKNVWVEVGGAWISRKRVVVLLNRQTVQQVTSDPGFPPYLKSLSFIDLNSEADSRYLLELAARIAGKVSKGQKR